MNKEEAKQKIEKLVERYKNLSDHEIKSFTEEETKKGFIEPFFEALGWNISDKLEVSAEENQQAGRPDYGFYLNGRLKFFLEAKSFKADLNNEEFAKQAIRYSWNRGADWAVLTDFEGLKVFYAQGPSKFLQDKKYFELSFENYISDFEKLWELSKEAFEENLIEKNAVKAGKMPPKVSVGSKLYRDLNLCREILTDKLGKMNDTIDKNLLDEGVQKILNRLIFIRVAEDRGVEDETLIPLIRKWEASGRKKTLFESMVDKFRELDESYNSNLFSEHPLEKWDEYSGVTKEVVSILKGKTGYFDYDFKAMPADVLGSVYENYLGYKLSQSEKGLTIDKNAKKRKEQGIYYTPIFIVDYIVKNALKPVLDKCQSINDLKKIKVLDPACGSGSFLIRAMDEIAKKYEEFGARLDEYTKLTILLENIYGVDLDDQAVEIARLNLLINALDRRMKLPDLSKNIKNGNSLVSGSDTELQKYFGKNFRDKKPFNWKEEFPEVFEQDGFDVVIGNPPYIFSRDNLDESEKKFYYENYQLTQFKINTYILFVEKSFEISNTKGVVSLIIPNNWLTLENASDFRKFCITKTYDLEIVNIKAKVFQDASVDSSILTFKKQGKSIIRIFEMNENTVSMFAENEANKYLEIPNYVINCESQDTNIKYEICLRISTISEKLGDIVDVKNGVQAYTVGEGKPIQTEKMKDERVYHSKEKIDDSWLKYVDGVDIGRYSLGWSGQFIKYGENLSRSRRYDLFHGNRILIRQIPSKPPYSILASFTEELLVNDNNGMIVKTIDNDSKYNIIYLLGLLNSRLISFWFNHIFNKFQRKIFPQFKVNELARFPIFPATKEQQKPIVVLVDKMLLLQKQLVKSQENSNEWQSLKHEIELTDKKINDEVYKLYGITEEERKEIEK